MKHLAKILLIGLILSLTAGSCKNDDDKPESTIFAEYFECKINNEVFKPKGIPFSCSPLAWNYYSENNSTIPPGYALLRGTICESSESVGIRIHGLQHQSGTLDFLDPHFADSVSPFISFIDTIAGNYVVIEKLIDGQMIIDRFVARESGSSPLGEIRGTFEFTITDSLGLDTLRITEGRFRFQVPQIF